MLPGYDDTSFIFELQSLPCNAEFFAESEGVRSSVSLLKTIELPRVQRITVPGVGQEVIGDGDITAPAGTRATLNIETDRPLVGAQLVVEPGDSTDLAATEENRTSVSLTVMRHAWYHVSARSGDELVKISDDYEITVPAADRSKPRPANPVILRSGAIPAGYEQAVARYYQRLSDLKVPGPAK
jgi:hypothetical protein